MWETLEFNFVFMFSLLRRLQSLTRKFADAFQRNALWKFHQKWMMFSEKIFFVAKFWTEINGTLREHCCWCHCKFIFHLFIVLGAHSVLKINIMICAACWKVSNEVQTGANTMKFANNLVFFFQHSSHLFCAFI